MRRPTKPPLATASAQGVLWFWLGEFKGPRSNIRARACAYQACGQYKHTYVTHHALGNGYEVFATDDDKARPDAALVEHHLADEQVEPEVKTCPCCGQTIKEQS